MTNIQHDQHHLAANASFLDVKYYPAIKVQKLAVGKPLHTRAFCQLLMFGLERKLISSTDILHRSSFVIYSVLDNTINKD